MRLYIYRWKIHYGPFMSVRLSIALHAYSLQLWNWSELNLERWLLGIRRPALLWLFQHIPCSPGYKYHWFYRSTLTDWFLPSPSYFSACWLSKMVLTVVKTGGHSKDNFVGYILPSECNSHKCMMHTSLLQHDVIYLFFLAELFFAKAFLCAYCAYREWLNGFCRDRVMHTCVSARMYRMCEYQSSSWNLSTA